MRTVYTVGLLGIIFVLHSCASNHTTSNRMIQKRKYQKGFHIAKRGKLQSKHEKSKPNDYAYQDDSRKSKRVIESQLLPEKPRVLKEEREVPGIHRLLAQGNESPTSTLPVFEQNEDEKCDIIMLKNGDEISAKVTEIGTTEIKYKQCSNVDGPTYTLKKQDIFKIKYANGTSELISSVESTEPTARTPMSPATVEQKNRTIRGLSIASIIVSLAGTVLMLFFWFGSLFISIAIILALTALTMLIIQPREQRSRTVANLTYIALGVSIFAPIVGLIIVLILL